ncbi:hypothetical protein F4802DRAFT_176513 [Xylaria palmicola]|nr:hypothetical protein F4802DRAFT_176513 [Xylaria palmicola]
MRLWPVSSTAVGLFCVTAMARLDRGTKQLSRPNVDGRGEGARETLHLRADPTSTATNRQPTMSTPYAVPLTTTFIPPESCNQGQLSMLSPPGYFIWLNEPVPVPGTTIADCYPSEFMEYYTTYHVNPTTVGSLVPLMSPLVCPFGWQVVLKDDDYQACCPSGYDLALPTTPLDPNRPAYGGTCYSGWALSSSTYVERYGSASASGSILVTASTTPFQAYAHVIDGIATSISSPTSSSQNSAESAQSGRSGNTSLAPGAIAGIVVGVVVAAALLVVGCYLFARRRRQSRGPTAPTPPPKDGVGLASVSSPIGTESMMNHPAEAKSTITGYSEMAAGEQHAHELDAGHMPPEKP